MKLLADRGGIDLQNISALSIGGAYTASTVEVEFLNITGSGWLNYIGVLSGDGDNGTGFCYVTADGEKFSNVVVTKGNNSSSSNNRLGGSSYSIPIRFESSLIIGGSVGSGFGETCYWEYVLD